MRQPSGLITLLALLLILLPTVLARQQPTSYCKCICFTNSTIIPLNSPPTQSSAPAFLASRDDTGSKEKETKHRALTCSDCNRSFCLGYNLPICRDAKEEDVFATCFQRDSLKDETVVVLFLVATAGLLGWALVKPFLGKVANNEAVQKYTPLPLRGQGGVLPRVSDEAVESTQRSRTRPGGGSISRQGGLNS